MIKLLYFILPICFIIIGCSSKEVQPSVNSTPSPTPTVISTPSEATNSSNFSQSETNDTPNYQILKQAELIRTRLRYFGEELKTTYTVEKQKALMENVRESIKPAYEEIEAISKANNLENNTSIKNILQVCSRLDEALATHDPKVLPAVLKDFNPAFEKLQNNLMANNKSTKAK